MQTDAAKVLTALADYPDLQILFGPVITARLAAPNPACYLLQALEGRLHTLAWWQQRCAAYLANVTSIDAAVTKLAEDLVGAHVKTRRMISTVGSGMRWPRSVQFASCH